MTSCSFLAKFVLALALALGAALWPVAAWAEKSDRGKPMVIEADRSAVIDSQRQVMVYSGKVFVSQGSMLLRADRIEIREGADGYRSATASGAQGKPVTWQQRREGAEETVEGRADRIELDGRTDTLRLIGNSELRTRRNGTITYEVAAGVIVWDNTSEVLKVEGGEVTPVNPTGRVRAVLTPSSPAASQPRPATSSPLAPSRALGDRR